MKLKIIVSLSASARVLGSSVAYLVNRLGVLIHKLLLQPGLSEAGQWREVTGLEDMGS